ncbi:dehydrogenase [Gordonibacter sp. 28C]|uniref:molybdopterin-dependent oxidoreductase n=1 Tax=Gordonibacter sp. 28C TaxID=2078569 RepID=UPI000DF72E11|nr:molybdopterin-dependent oxidoreductase [Gordonibacter sp. 28C]RDB63884.1 dehydrogenase [Gordonibacter sp. 28C]
METIAAGQGFPLHTRKDGETVTRTSAWTAPGCHNGCGIKIHTDDQGNVTKIEGDEATPFNQGRLCARCFAVPDALAADDRLLYPLKRAREDRGKDKFERITWDEAYDLIEATFNDIKEKYGAESVIFQQGTGRDITPYITRLSWSFGSPNFGGVGQSGDSCYLPRIAGMVGTLGGFWLADYSQQFVDRFDNPEWRAPGVIFNVGVNLLVSNSDGVMGYWMVECLKRGSKLINVDPKITWLSSRADLVLRPRPGTDGALAMGMINYLIENDLYDKDFVDKWCYGFEQLAERAKEYPLSKVAAITWLAEDDIVRATRMIVEDGPAALQWGLAADSSNAEAVPAAHAMQTVFQITGNVDVPGGMIMPTDILPGGYAGGWGRELISQEQLAKKIGIKKYPMYAFATPYTESEEVLKVLESGEPYELHACWNQTMNPISCMAPEPERVLRAFQKLDFFVDVTPYMTPTTMALADVVLPVCLFPERNGVALTTGSQRAAAMVKVTEPRGESKSDQQINLELGKRFNPKGWPWDTVEEMFTEMIKPTGYTFEELCEVSPVLPAFQYRKYEKGLLRPDGQPGFNTSTGRIELWCGMFQSIGQDPLPYYEEVRPGPLATPDLYEKYPLILTTGVRRWTTFHSEHRNMPRMRAIVKEPLAQMNPADAEKYGVKDNDIVELYNNNGKAHMRLRVTPEIMEGNIQTDHAWWFPEGDPEDLYGVMDVNVNNLCEYDCGKHGFGTNIKAQLCAVRKYEE